MENSPHLGRGNIRKLHSSFEVTGPDGRHIVIIFEAAQMSLRDMKVVFRKDGFDEEFVKAAMIELLKALDFLHTRGEVVHTGIDPFSAYLAFASPLISYCYASLLQLYIRAICSWVFTITTSCRHLARGNSRLQWLASQSRPLGQSTTLG